MSAANNKKFEEVFHMLQDCYEEMEEPTSSEEINYKLKIINLCTEIATEYSDVRDFPCTDKE